MSYAVSFSCLFLLFFSGVGLVKYSRPSLARLLLLVISSRRWGVVVCRRHFLAASFFLGAIRAGTCEQEEGIQTGWCGFLPEGGGMLTWFGGEGWASNLLPGTL